MNQEYLRSIYNYYNEKNSHKPCKSCKSDKVFKETNNKLIFSCGDDNTKLCGIQLDIDIPEYVNINHMNDIKEYVNEQINTKSLLNYIDVPVTDFTNEYNYISKLEKLYKKQNNIIEKSDLYNDIIKKRRRLYAEININDPKKYAKNIKQINELYREMIEIVSNISNILIIENPIVNKDNTKKTKKTSNMNIKVKWVKNKKTLYGVVEHIIKDKFVVKSGNNQFVLKRDKLEIISDNEYSDATLEHIIKIGDRVSWLNKSNIQMSGLVIDINKKNAIIEDDNKDNYVLPIESLNK